MVRSARVKIYAYESRHSINLPKDLIEDSSFPFKVKEDLVAQIEGDRLVITKAGKK